MRRDEATERQVQAARPDVSTWLSANAGSGKTRVLTDRVARLLLSEVSPEHILCLTYTKAAATEMQNRLFKRLGDWAMKPADDLRVELQKLGVTETITPQKLSDARTLFARALETPGGLKIQTIHSFCSSLLRRFPMEAGVSPQFKEMEDRAATLLREDIVDRMADGKEAAQVAAIATHLTDEDFTKLTAEIVNHRAGFAAPMSWEQIAKLFDLPADAGEQTALSAAFRIGDLELLHRCVPVMAEGTVTDQKIAQAWRGLDQLNTATLRVLEDTLLTGGGAKEPFSAKLGSVPTKTTQKKMAAADLSAMNDLMQRIEAARALRVAYNAAQKTQALHQFATPFLAHYDHAKTLRGWLDFDDLITRARDLLSDPVVAQWVLYRIDGGIDHILVDEAQDTSPVQWQVIERLAAEFTSGQGAREEVTRTIFVVGDKKQSIYSFQGADPGEFDRMRDDFRARLESIGAPFEDSTLDFSFRSSEAILRLVDNTFMGKAAAGFSEDKHRAFKQDLPGRVDVWPLVPKIKDEDDRKWFEPVDRKSQQRPSVVLAERVADEIGRMIRENVAIPQELDGDPNAYVMRPVTAGDFLILVQRRSDVFQEIIRACKSRNLPIAGADRLKVGAELAVRDLGALLTVLATPEDDLALATILKSPLFGWSEQALFTLAHGRDGFLWQALRNAREAHPETMAILNDLRSQADFLRPYDLIERILTRHNGRKNLLARLGTEAEDGINALLSQSLAFERDNVPSLTGFLLWMETDDLEIKRQMDSAGDKIRVMTVHGAKGLEAPIVILPDTTSAAPQLRGSLAKTAGGTIWRMRADESPAVQIAVQNERKAKQQAERERLLYVAMTRAEKWLIVAGAGETGKDGLAWYDRVSAGMETSHADTMKFAGDIGTGTRLEHGDWGLPSANPNPGTDTDLAVLDPIFAHPAPVPTEALPTLSPSELGGAKALATIGGLDEEAAKHRGSQIHALLEHLPAVPQSEWARLAPAILTRAKLGAPDTELPALLVEVTAVLTHTDLAGLFARPTLAEVPITATLSQLGGRRISGVIDLLQITPNRVLAIDFKTNATVPATPETCPDALLRQMGAYAAALSQIYPNHEIATAILWTATPELMVLPHDLVTDALATTRTP